MKKLSRWYYQRQALSAFSAGNYEQALENYAELEKIEERRMGTRHNIGLCYLALSRHEDAEKCFLDEIETYGPAFARLKTIADMYYAWGKRTKALKYYKAAAKECTDDTELRLITRRTEIASDPAKFERVAEANVAHKKGNELLQAGKVDDAFDSFRDAVKADPTSFQSMNNLGAIAMNRRKNPAAAAAFFEAASRLSPLPSIKRNLERARSMAENGPHTGHQDEKT